MFAYIARRLLLMIPTLIGIITITFFIAEFVPGGPVDQVRALLEGEAAGDAEASGGSVGHSLRRQADPKLEATLKRTYGLHHPLLERYARTLLWFGRDSIITSAEVDAGTTAKFISRQRNCIVLRLDNEYHAYVNYWAVDGEPGEVVYDRTLKQFRSVIDGTRFDIRTGAALDGTGSLTKLATEVRETADGTAVYLTEGFGKALFNWDNWHGFFLGKFGKSIHTNKTVVELIKDRLPVSMSLGIISFFLTYSVCLMLGIAKAVRHGTRFDTFSSVIVLFGYSVPGFVLAVLLIVLFGPGDAHIVELIPIAGLTSAEVEGYAQWPWWQKVLDYLHHLITPIICLSIGSFATLTMLTKNSILDQIHQPYVVTARAKGLSERVVLYKHVLRNSLIPLVTGFPSGFMSMFFAGSLLIEKIFSLNGLGLLSYQAVIERDFPVVMGSLFIFTILGLIGQLLTDICYVIVDPRITFDESAS